MVAACKQCQALYVLATEAPAGAAKGSPAAASGARGKEAPPLFTAKTPTPKEIHKVLGDFVVGQERAKRYLAVAVYNHYKRLHSNLGADKAGSSDKDGAADDTKAGEKDDGLDGVTFDKSNILMLGPTGSGKTLMAKTLARVLHVPFAMADCTTLTQAGCAGMAAGEGGRRGLG